MNEIENRKLRLQALWSDGLAPIQDSLTESDVRAKYIDPLFSAGLGWPEHAVRREDRTDAGGYIDFSFGFPQRVFVLESKRASSLFRFPSKASSVSNRFTVKQLMSSDAALKDAIQQVQKYASDQAFPYAVVSNGVQLALFRAVRTDRPWRDGACLVFRSTQEILDRFHELWELLSYPSVSHGSLDQYFMFPDEMQRTFESPLATYGDADEKLIRNRIANTITPILKKVFDDVTDDATIDVLKNCYVFSDELRYTADSFVIAVRDLPPSFLKSDVKHIQATPDSGSHFADAVRAISTQGRRGTVLLLLGGVGAGKTTFLRQIRTLYCKDTIESSGAYFNIDFRNAPEAGGMDEFVYETLRQQLSSDPLFRVVAGASSNTGTFGQPSVLLRMFAEEIEESVDIARAMGVMDESALASKRVDVVERCRHDSRLVVKRSMRMIGESGRFILIAFDNADQLDIDYQLRIFLFAQNVASETGANVVVALREEKYYVASQKGAFNAFHTQKFHIPSPRLTELLRQRLKYSISNIDSIIPHVEDDLREDARDLLSAILNGGVGAGRASNMSNGSSNVVRLLERTCHGNMRLALTMFRDFTQSGNTDVDKILRIYRDGGYFVPFHEFTKSVMLGDYRFYRERHTDHGVVNVFQGSGHPPSSHFTSLRLLQYLMHRSERPSKYGTGFCEVGEIYQAFDTVFSDHVDAAHQLSRLLRNMLVESDTTALDVGVSAAVRATASGEYYVTYFVRAFAYLDLVWMDTAVADQAVLVRLRELLTSKEMERRFERVDAFLSHLEAEEEREFRLYQLLNSRSEWCHRLVPGIRAQIDKEKGVIRRKMRHVRSDRT